MEDNRIKHLEMIQNKISRMNSNSFQIKGWMIAVVSALFAICVSSNNVSYIYVALIPTLAFWLLDAYYLNQERRFRELYKDVLSPNSVILPFSMPIDKYRNSKCCFWGSFFSLTVCWLYGIILLVIVGIVLHCILL